MQNIFHKLHYFLQERRFCCKTSSEGWRRLCRTPRAPRSSTATDLFRPHWEAEIIHCSRGCRTPRRYCLQLPMSLTPSSSWTTAWNASFCAGRIFCGFKCLLSYFFRFCIVESEEQGGLFHLHCGSSKEGSDLGIPRGADHLLVWHGFP